MSASAHILHHSPAPQFILNTLQYSNRPAGITAVIAPLHHAVIGIRSNYSDLYSFLFQRQNAVVLQQNHAFLCHTVGKFIMLL